MKIFVVLVDKEYSGFYHGAFSTLDRAIAYAKTLDADLAAEIIEDTLDDPEAGNQYDRIVWRSWEQLKK